MNDLIRQRFELRKSIYIPYAQQLLDEQWKEKRKKIIERDGGVCTCCKNNPTDYNPLNVHHNFYVYDKKAWEYNDDVLITLCQNCHHKFHIENKVKVYTDETQKREFNFTRCKRCGGLGLLPQYSYIEGGICFRCMGARYEELIPEKLRKINEKEDLEEYINKYKPDYEELYKELGDRAYEIYNDIIVELNFLYIEEHTKSLETYCKENRLDINNYFVVNSQSNINNYFNEQYDELYIPYIDKHHNMMKFIFSPWLNQMGLEFGVYNDIDFIKKLKVATSFNEDRKEVIVTVYSIEALREFHNEFRSLYG